MEDGRLEMGGGEEVRWERVLELRKKLRKSLPLRKGSLEEG